MTTTVTPREADQVATANESGRQPVVFIHGLWLLQRSWDAWRELFEEQGYATVAVDWPGDPADYTAAHADPSAFAKKGVGQVADHVAEVVGELKRKPIVIGHSFGGLLAQIVAGRGLALATVSSTRRRAEECCRCRSRRSRPPSPCSATRPTTARR